MVWVQSLPIHSFITASGHRLDPTIVWTPLVASSGPQGRIVCYTEKAPNAASCNNRDPAVLAPVSESAVELELQCHLRVRLAPGPGGLTRFDHRGERTWPLRYIAQHDVALSLARDRYNYEGGLPGGPPLRPRLHREQTRPPPGRVNRPRGRCQQLHLVIWMPDRKTATAYLLRQRPGERHLTHGAMGKHQTPAFNVLLRAVVQQLTAPHGTWLALL